MKIKLLGILSILCFCVPIFAQTNSSEWISISNEYIRISLDKKTGRYVISDVQNTYPTKNIPVPSLPEYIEPASPISSNIISPQSVLLGSIPNAANLAVFSINDSTVTFGSQAGRWLSSPIVSSNESQIIYTWKLGALEIMQVLSIVSNKDTLLNDAVRISYYVQNKGDNIERLGGKIILDPSTGDGQETPFRLPEGTNITTEYRITRGELPDYWFSTDQRGELSPYTIRGFLKGGDNTTPDSVTFTTLKNALKAPWSTYLNTKRPLKNTYTAVILMYDPKPLSPGETKVLTTTIGVSGIVNGRNNGLRIDSSVFSAQDTNPIKLDFWVNNTSSDFYDQVILELQAPSVFNILSQNPQEINNLAPMGMPYYVGWQITSTSDLSGNYQVQLNARALKNGETVASLSMPFAFSLNSNSVAGENERINQAINDSLSNLLTPSPSSPAPLSVSVATSGYLPGDTFGPASDSLGKLYDYLIASEFDNVEDILKLIETERQLMKEITELQRSLSVINNQYEVIRRIYKQLYEDNTYVERSQYQIQNIEDSLSRSEKKISDQESSMQELLQQSSSPIIYETTP